MSPSYSSPMPLLFLSYAAPMPLLLSCQSPMSLLRLFYALS